MCDWCVDGLWSAPSAPNNSLAGFRVSDALWQRLQVRQAWHHKQGPCLAFGVLGDFLVAGFTKGLEVAKAVKRAAPTGSLSITTRAKPLKQCSTTYHARIMNIGERWFNQSEVDLALKRFDRGSTPSKIHGVGLGWVFFRYFEYFLLGYFTQKMAVF